MAVSAAPVIYINGFPGVGKLTIATALQQLMQDSVLIHNHQLIDPVEKTCPRGSLFYAERRATYRRKFLSPIAHDLKTKDTMYIFTDSQVEYNECMGDYRDLALGSNGNGPRRFYSIVLTCDFEENARRITAPDRGEEGSKKLKDVELLREIRVRYGVWKFGGEDELVLDVTKMGTMEAAEKIKEFFEKRQREGKTSMARGEV